MHESIDGRQRHRLAGKDLSPLAERLVGGDEHRSAFISACAAERNRKVA